MRLSIKIFLLFISFFFFLPEPSNAATNFNLNLTGGKKKEELMTVTAQIKGTDCTEEPKRITEVMLNGEGAGYPFAADFSNSQITAYLNGKEIVGHRRTFSNPPMINSILLHADPAFSYDPKTDSVSIYVSNIRRGNVGGIAFSMYLLENDRNDIPAFDSCVSGRKHFNTITPRSDSELLPGDPPNHESTEAIKTPEKKIPKALPTISQIQFTPQPTVTKKIQKINIQEKSSWFESIIVFVKEIFK